MTKCLEGMTQERFAEIKKIQTGLGNHGLLVGIIHELIAENERLQAWLISEIDMKEQLKAEVTRWQERARLYHNHLVMMQQDREAVIQ